MVDYRKSDKIIKSEEKCINQNTTVLGEIFRSLFKEEIIQTKISISSIKCSN